MDYFQPSFIHARGHSFHRHLLRASYLLGTFLGTEDTAENKTGPGPCPPGAYTVGQQTSQRAGKINPVRTAQVTMGAPGRDRASHTLLQN